MLETTHLRRHFDELSEKMWTLIPIDPEISLKLRQNAEVRLKAQQFRPAELAATKKVSTAIRNDQIFWLDAKSPTAADCEIEFLYTLQSIMNALREEMRVSLRYIECHYAFYQKGHYYQKHRDTTSVDNKRIFSFVLYLNENWQIQDGGELVGYDGAETIFTVRPYLGQLIIFRSEIEHEVKITARDRLSLTGWFRC